MKRIVCYSGGIASALVAVEVVGRFGAASTVLLNHDISSWVEDADIKRFKAEVAQALGMVVTQANIGGELDPDRIPDQFDVCMKAKAFKVGMGTELCTSRLKTEPFLAWLREYHPDPSTATCYYGFEGEEPARIERRRRILGELGYQTAFPVAEWEQTLQSIREMGVEPPGTYAVWKHANCQGCLKAGKQHWYVVFVRRPDIWAKAKTAEEYIGYSIHKGAPLESLEPLFSAMQQAGVPATENIPSGQFWSTARRMVREQETSQNLGGLFDPKMPLL